MTALGDRLGTTAEPLIDLLSPVPTGTGVDGRRGTGEGPFPLHAPGHGEGAEALAGGGLPFGRDLHGRRLRVLEVLGVVLHRDGDPAVAGGNLDHLPLAVPAQVGLHRLVQLPAPGESLSVTVEIRVRGQRPGPNLLA